ncbi:hypothetical protein CKO09_10930 [Chromatium weissei]|nr:hypothetical protein [Chromatium weissei]
MRECSASASSDALILPVLTSDLTAPDLAAPLHPLIPVFPLVIHDTALVLEADALGGAVVHWHLEANDYIGVSQSFAATSDAPTVVLRLRRFRTDGGADAAAEVQLHLTGYQSDGDRNFAVENEAAQFEAELGLTNATGGWLLLARSNRLLLGAGTAPPSTREMELPAELPQVAPQPSSSAPPSSDAATATVSIVAIQTLAAVDMPADPHFDAPSMPLAPIFPLPVVAEFSAVIDENSSVVEIQPLFSTAPAIHSEFSADTSPSTSPAPSSIPMLLYGRVISPNTGVIIEAELRIHGWGAPNAEIDLFGQPYQLGAGGRFQLLLRVDDAALLAEALRQHPPPELTRSRFD